MSVRQGTGDLLEESKDLENAQDKGNVELIAALEAVQIGDKVEKKGKEDKGLLALNRDVQLYITAFLSNHDKIMLMSDCVEYGDKYLLVKLCADNEMLNVHQMNEAQTSSETLLMYLSQYFVEAGEGVKKKPDLGLIMKRPPIVPCDLSMIEFLLSLPSLNINEQCRQFKATALMQASYRNNRSMVKLLLAANASIDMVNSVGWTALMYTCGPRGHGISKECMQLLIAAGADANAQSFKGQTALNFAACRGATAAVEILLASGADPLLCDNQGCSPLFWPCVGGHSVTVQALIKGGCDPNAEDKGGMTPLALAVESNSGNCVSVLLREGAIVSQELFDAVQAEWNSGPVWGDGTGGSALAIYDSMNILNDLKAAMDKDVNKDVNKDEDKDV